MKKIFWMMAFVVFCSTAALAETVRLENGMEFEGRIFEVTDDYIRMFSDGEILKLRFRNMDIDSSEKYRDYVPRPYDGPVRVEREPAPQPKTYRDYTREGLDYAQQGQFPEAIAAFNEAIDIRDDVWDIYLFRAGAYQQAGRLDKALEDYTTVITRNPRDPDAYARRGWVYQSQGQWRKAVRDYSRVLELDPGNIEILMERYNIYKEHEQWWKAKEDIEYLIALSPDQGEPYVDQAFLNYRIGSYFNAWKSVYDAGKRKVRVPPEFIEMLSQRYEDPFLRKQESQPKPTAGQAIKGVIDDYWVWIVLALMTALLGVGVLFLPSRPRGALRFSAAGSQQEPDQESPDAQEPQRNDLFHIVVFKKASFSKRLCAGLFDFFIFSTLAWAVQLMTTMDVFAAALAVLFFFRDSFGASPGKSLVGLRVIDDHGYRAVFLQGFIRNFPFALPLIIFYVLIWGAGFEMNLVGQLALAGVCLFYILESAWTIFSKTTGRRIGDRMAGTFVHDLHPEWWRWPFMVMSAILAAGYLCGMVVLNMKFNQTFLYQLNPMRYYNSERRFSFKRLSGWDINSSGDGGLLLTNEEMGGSILLMYNAEVRDYSLDLCVSAFNQNMQANGLDLRKNESITVSGRPAYKVGFMDAQSNMGIMFVYFKKEPWGDLYLVQVSSPANKMRYVMSDASDFINSFRFE